jgi:hypothetical protein
MAQIDNVNHPAHYQGGFGVKPVECINVTEWLTFCLGNTVKYIWRLGRKDKGDYGYEDFKKAIWYLKRHRSLPNQAHYTGNEDEARAIFNLCLCPDSEDTIGMLKYRLIYLLLREEDYDPEYGAKSPNSWLYDIDLLLKAFAQTMIDENKWPEEAENVWSL